MKILTEILFVAGLATLILIPLGLLAEDFATLKNPIPNTSASISKGQVLYVQWCAEFHGKDGKAQIDVVSNATDLTSPEMYYSGTSEGEIFHSTRDGAGVGMPPYSFELTDEEIWHMVNFMRNLWPAEQRPPIIDGA
jgi:mono/diheme cytochrome c family protein